MTTDDGQRPDDKPKKEVKKDKKKSNYFWALKIFFITFAISGCLSFVSETVSSSLPFAVAAVMLVFFILIGIVFDTIGLAVATATASKFHSMATKKVRGARAALWLITKADIVSNFCNDVIGDISSVLSGAITAFLAVSIHSAFSVNLVLTTVIVTALTSALTVGGKALGKTIALNNGDSIVLGVSRILCLFIPERKFIGKGQ